MEQVAQTNSKTRISLPTDSMKRVKSASGGVSFHCGDAVATKLNGLPLERIKTVAASMGFPSDKYDHLNPGQQRMNLGNLLRSAVRRDESLLPTFIEHADLQQAEHDLSTAEARAAADAAKKEKADAKAAEQAAKDAAKAAKTKERADAAAAKLKAKEDAKAAREQARADKKAEKAAAKAAKEAAEDAEAQAKAAEQHGIEQ